MIDVVQRLEEMEQCIAMSQLYGLEVPEEAFELKEIMERCVAAELFYVNQKRIAADTAEAMHLDREAYEAYARHTGWKSLVSGADLPQWDQLSDEIRIAWRVSAAWVIGRTLRHFGVWN